MPAAEGMGSRIARGAAWMVGMRMGIRGLGMISTVILARLLVPADFGMVAMALAVGAALDTLLEPNFGLAIITERRRDRISYDAAWTWSIVKGLVIGAVLSVFAPLIAAYFREPRIVPIIYVLAALSALSGFQNIGTVDFVKDLQLHRNFVMGFGAKLFSFAVTVTAAAILRNYWALVAGMIASRAVTVLLSFLLSSFRPRLSFRGSVSLLNFSSWALVGNIIGTLVSQADALIIGRVVAARALGIYGVANEISALPATEIVTPARQALFGGMVNWADDPKKLARNYAEALAVMITVALPLSVGMMLVADPMVRILLGARWLEAAPLIQLLAFAGFARLFSDNVWTALYVLRKPAVCTVISGIESLFYIVFLYYGVITYGLYGAALGRTAAMVISLVVNSIVLRRYLDTSLALAFRLAIRTIFATAVMAAVLLELGLAQENPFGLGVAAGFALSVTSGVIVFAAVHGLLWAILGRGEGVEGRLLQMGAGFLGRPKRPAAL